MSKEKAEREQLIKEVTQGILTDKFTKEVGSKAVVERWKLKNDERVAQLREVLRDIAKDLQACEPTIKGFEHLGSLSVHVFHSSVLNQMVFLPFTATDKLPLNVIITAIQDLKNSVIVDFNGRAQRKRNGL